MRNTMAIDQHGTTYHSLGAHPRTELAKRLGCSPRSARKMYCDTEDGQTKHIGYVFGRNWLTLYHVESWEGSHA